MTKTVSTITSKKAKGKSLSKDKKKPQKARVIRLLKDRESKLIENVKQTLLFHGNKSNQTLKQALIDLKKLKDPFSHLLMNNNDIHPFESIDSVEYLIRKNETSTFIIGSHSKKRPNSLVMGRTYDYHLLDMVEFGMDNYQSIHSFKNSSKKALGSKPCFLFHGRQFEQDETYKKVKNLLLDTFRGQVVKSIDLKGIDHVITCTAPEEKENTILFRVYSIGYDKVENQDTPKVTLTEMGPHMDLCIRRHKFASLELYKEALQKPKELLKKKVKNVSKDELTGNTLGRVFTNQQDIYSIKVKKTKALRKTGKNKTEEKEGEDEMKE